MFSELIEYNHCANQAFIDVFEAAGTEILKAEQLFSHILNAQHVWIARINYTPPNVGVWDVQPKEKYRELEEEHHAGFEEILKKSDFFLPITYKNSLGEFTNTIGEILLHAFNHATYHRGQIASIFMANDVNPPITDFVYLKWKGEI